MNIQGLYDDWLSHVTYERDAKARLDQEVRERARTEAILVARLQAQDQGVLVKARKGKETVHIALSVHDGNLCEVELANGQTDPPPSPIPKP